ncbi:Elongation factor 2 kinase [Entamoeba marina]
MKQSNSLSHEMLSITDDSLKEMESSFYVPTPYSISSFTQKIFDLDSVYLLFVIDASSDAEPYHYQLFFHLMELLQPQNIQPNHSIAAIFIGDIEVDEYRKSAYPTTVKDVLTYTSSFLAKGELYEPLIVYHVSFQNDIIPSHKFKSIVTHLPKTTTQIAQEIAAFSPSIEFLNSTTSFCISDFQEPLIRQNNLVTIPLSALNLRPIDFDMTTEVGGYLIDIDPTYYSTDEYLEYYSRPVWFNLHYVTMKISKFAFAQGGIRNAYHGTNCTDNANVVLKTFLSKEACEHLKYFDALEVNSIVRKLAWEFNQYQSSRHKRINFVKTSLFMPSAKVFPTERVKYYDLVKMANNSLYFVEPYLDGEFVKFNDNTFYVNMNQFSASIQCFSHWTYFRTAKRLIVVDLQGIVNKKKNEYLLTDPAVHHESLSKFYFTRTNHGTTGISNFFSSHTCNSICKELGIVDEGLLTIDLDCKTQYFY